MVSALQGGLDIRPSCRNSSPGKLRTLTNGLPLYIVSFAGNSLTLLTVFLSGQTIQCPPSSGLCSWQGHIGVCSWETCFLRAMSAAPSLKGPKQVAAAYRYVTCCSFLRSVTNCCLSQLCDQLPTSSSCVTSCPSLPAVWPAVHLFQLCDQLPTSPSCITSCPPLPAVWPAAHLFQLCDQLPTSPSCVTSFPPHPGVRTGCFSPVVYRCQDTIGLSYTEAGSGLLVPTVKTWYFKNTAFYSFQKCKVCLAHKNKGTRTHLHYKSWLHHIHYAINLMLWFTVVYKL